jgi:nucleoid-associated protein YgaU
MAPHVAHRPAGHSRHQDAQAAHSNAHHPTGDHSSDLKAAGVEIVTVQPGDSLWKLARKHLGRGTEWRALLKANPGIEDPTRLKVGSSLLV